MAGRLGIRQAILACHVSLIFGWLQTAYAHGELAFRMLTGANVYYIVNISIFSRHHNCSHDETTVFKQLSRSEFACMFTTLVDRFV